MSRLIDADELKKQAYKSGDWDKPLVVDVEAIDDAPTIDQWHYPSKGELPPKEEPVLCFLWNGNYCVAFKREDDEWTTNGRFTFDGVRCWQYIVPPKEEA